MTSNEGPSRRNETVSVVEYATGFEVKITRRPEDSGLAEASGALSGKET